MAKDILPTNDCLSVGDKKTADLFEKIRPGWLKRTLAAKVVFEYPTLEDMAKAHKIPLEALKKTVGELKHPQQYVGGFCYR